MTTLEHAILTPAVFAFLCVALVLGMWWMAQDRAHTAARKAVETGRSIDSSPEEGVAQAQAWLRGSPLLKQPSISAAGSSAARVRVTVTGTVVTPLLGWSFEVSESAQAPVERWET